MVHRLGHRQQASLGMADVEALKTKGEEKTLRSLDLRNKGSLRPWREEWRRGPTWMCNSKGTGRTLGWKLKVEVALQPSQ